MHTMLDILYILFSLSSSPSEKSTSSDEEINSHGLLYGY